MSKLKLAIVSILLLVLLVEVSGQNFPVRVTPIITPPYSPFLTDYTDPGSDKLTLQVMLNDITVSSYRCKFRLAIEGVNISITTNPNYLPAPITLQGGVPEIIYGSDIIDYFNPANLVYKGITQKEIEKNGNKLPEGVYRFTFEVLDYNRNLVVSNKGTVTAWMLLNDPPFINLPANNAKLKPFDPQNIVFQWTPRHRGSPNSAFTTEYEVKLVEIWPKGRNPYDAINTTRPIFETTTDATMVVYGPAETPLVLGREYALQVKAKDTGGKDLFKNNGYSEVVKFTYGDECPLPTSLLAEDIGTVKARIKWQGNGMNTGYTLRYRQKQQGTEWFEEHTNQSYFNAIGMQPGTVYEYEVGGECETFNSAYVGGQVFTTLIEDPNAFVCGDPNALPKLDGSPPLPALMINDFIHAGGFDVVVNSATGSDGQFSGTGQAIVPWFNSAKVRVTFENINVNKSYQLTGGTIKSVWDKDSKLLRTFEKTTSEEKVSTGFTSEVAGFVADSMVNVTGAIISVGTNSDGDIVVLNNEGETIVLEKGKSYAIADEVGNGYIIKEDGTILKTTATDAAYAGARGQRDYSDDPNQSVRFDKSMNTSFGFDAQREGTLAQNYIQTTNDKYVAWKALANGEQDEIAVIAEGSTDLNRVKYRRGSDTFTATTVADGQATLRLQGKTNATNEELLAIYTASDTSTHEVIAGQLNLISYDKLPAKNLVLVLVNETDGGKVDGAAIQSQLNAIYKQALASWNVNTIIQKIEVAGINENLLDDGESGMLSNYSGEMKQVLNAYLKGNTLASETYYLFLLNSSKSGNIAGYMPRSKQAGFIFLNGLLTPEEVQKTMAHELGHGAFHLKHTFSEFLSLNKGTTDNLMDYKGGIALNKYQWDHIHNPERVLGLFEDDEEGESVLASIPLRFTIKEAGKFVAYMTPDGKRIILEKNKYPIFYHGIINDNYNDVVPGVLIGFRDEPSAGQPINSGTQHWAKFSGSSFIGYDNYIYSKPVLTEDDQSLVIGLPHSSEGSNYALYKFNALPVSEYKNEFGEILSVTSSAFEDVGFFKTSNYDSYYVNGLNLIGDTQTQINDFELKIIKGQYVDVERLLSVTSLQGFIQVPHEEKPEMFLVIKIAEYQNRYPVFFQEFSAWFDQWSMLAMLKNPGITFTSNVISQVFNLYNNRAEWDQMNVTAEKENNVNSEYRKWKDNLTLHNDKLFDFYRNFLVSLQDHSKELSDQNLECLSAVRQKTTREIYDCIIRASEDELSRSGVLSTSDRIFVIKSLVKQFYVDEDSEEAILKLLKYFPSDFSSDDLLDDLENDCQLQMEIVGKDDKKTTKWICFWELLFTRVEDGNFLFGADNRKTMMKSFLTHYYRSQRYAQQIQGYNSNILSLNLTEVEKIRYNFDNDYQGIFRRLWTEVKRGNPLMAFNNSSDTYLELSSSIAKDATGNNSNSKIKVDQNVNNGFILSSTLYSQTFSPFDYALFTNRSSLDLLQDFSGRDNLGRPKAIPMPAMILLYASEVGKGQTQDELLQTGIDAISLAVPGGQLANLGKLGKALYYMDKISSVTSMGATAFETQDKDIQKLFNLTSAATGILSMGSLATADNLNNVAKANNLLDNSNDIVGNTNALAGEVLNMKGTNKLSELTSKQAETIKSVLVRDNIVLPQMGYLNDAAQRQKITDAIAALDGVAKSSFKSIDALLELVKDTKYSALLEADLRVSSSLAEAMGKDPVLLNVWKEFVDAGVDTALKRDPDLLIEVLALPCEN